MSLKILLPAFLLLFWMGGDLMAQQLRATFPSLDHSAYALMFESTRDRRRLLDRRPSAITFAVDTVGRDYRWEGLVIGGLVLGLGAAILGNRLCNDDNIADKQCTGATLGLGLVGATVGVVTGGLVGSIIPKR